MFISTLQPPLYEHMVGSVSSNIVDIVIFGERVEAGIKSGRINYFPTMVANVNPIYYSRPYQHESLQTLYYTQPNWGSNSRSQGKKVMNFTLIPMTYTKLLPNLLCNSLVSICPTKLTQPPHSKNYDANAKCDYRGGVIGHSTEISRHSNVSIVLCRLGTTNLWKEPIQH